MGHKKIRDNRTPEQKKAAKAAQSPAKLKGKNKKVLAKGKLKKAPLKKRGAKKGKPKLGAAPGKAKTAIQFRNAYKKVIKHFIEHPDIVAYNTLFWELCEISYHELRYLKIKHKEKVTDTYGYTLNKLWKERLMHKAIVDENKNAGFIKWILSCGSMDPETDSNAPGMMTEYERQQLAIKNQELDILEAEVNITIGE